MPSVHEGCLQGHLQAGGWSGFQVGIPVYINAAGGTSLVCQCSDVSDIDIKLVLRRRYDNLVDIGAASCPRELWTIYTTFATTWDHAQRS